MATASINKVLQLFNMLSKPEQIEIADKIDKQTFSDRWAFANDSLPDTDITEEEIMNEVRSGRKKA